MINKILNKKNLYLKNTLLLLDSMEIEHKLNGTQVKYGYIWWKIRDDKEYTKIFPNGKFKIKICEKEVTDRKINPMRRSSNNKDYIIRSRVYIGTKIMRKNFKENDRVIISKEPGSNIISISKE
jgi:hypothetical protein